MYSLILSISLRFRFSHFTPCLRRFYFFVFFSVHFVCDSHSLRLYFVTHFRTEQTRFRLIFKFIFFSLHINLSILFVQKKKRFFSVKIFQTKRNEENLLKLDFAQFILCFFFLLFSFLCMISFRYMKWKILELIKSRFTKLMPVYRANTHTWNWGVRAACTAAIHLPNHSIFMWNANKRVNYDRSDS